MQSAVVDASMSEIKDNTSLREKFTRFIIELPVAVQGEMMNPEL